MTKVAKQFGDAKALGNYKFNHFLGTLVTFEIYLASSTARVSRITVTLIWPG